MVGADPLVTALFVPADRPERFAKAAASQPDAVILDLEDAVAPGMKQAARNNLDCAFTALPVILRINGADTEWHGADIAAARASGCAAVMLPKAEDPRRVAQVIDELGLPVIALIESAAGLAQARAMAKIDGVAGLAFGSVDFCADLGCTHLREVLLPARSELVLASRLAGKCAPLDGVTTRLDDLSVTSADAEHARNLGMSGKLCIHPLQVAPVRQAFAPTQADVVWATRILQADEADGAARVDGEMVDRPVRLRARAILSAARIQP